ALVYDAVLCRLDRALRRRDCGLPATRQRAASSTATVPNPRDANSTLTRARRDARAHHTRTRSHTDMADDSATRALYRGVHFGRCRDRKNLRVHVSVRRTIAPVACG